MDVSPIIIIGTHRSGTTWLGDVFGLHPDLAYWKEPRFVWSWGNYSKSDDLLTEHDATPRIIKHIHTTFANYVDKHQKTRLVEKTPSNCLRIPFIRAVYPHAKLVVLIRDGRSVVHSTEERRQQGFRWRRALERMREVPITQWGANARDIDRLVRKLMGKPAQIWGPRPPGWKEWVKSDPPSVVLAKQWSATMGQAMRDIRLLNEEQVCIVRYETLVTHPEREMRRILEFAKLASGESLVETVVKTAVPERARRWNDELPQDILEQIRPHMEPMLEQLGYQW